MAEDIDDLLEEVESKFLTKDKKQSRSKNNRKEKRLAFYCSTVCSTPKEINKKNLEVYSFSSPAFIGLECNIFFHS